ncbi:MAG: WD40 repeat domain-containing protein, partial [Blastocatellia bacterium]
MSPSGKLLAGFNQGFGDWDGTLQIWDMSSATQILSLKETQAKPSSIALSPDNRVIAQSGESGRGPIRLWDTTEGTTLRVLTGHSHEVRSLAFSPDGKLLASGSEDESVKLWDVETGRVRTLTGHTGYVDYVVFSLDGKMLASMAECLDDADDDKAIRLWDVGSGQLIKAVTPSASPPSAIDFSPNGKVLAVGNYGKTISLVDVATGQVVKILSGHGGKIGTVTFISDVVLQSLSYNEEKKEYERFLWKLPSGELLNATRFDESSKSIEGPSLLLGNSKLFAITRHFYALPMKDDAIKLFSLTERGIDPTAQPELGTLFLLDDDNWLVTTPEGLFDGSPGAWRDVTWRFNNNTFDRRSVEIYFNDFYYPNLLQSLFNGRSPQVSSGLDLEKIDRRQPQLLIGARTRDIATEIDAAASEKLGTDERLAWMTIVVSDNLDKPRQPDQAQSSGAQDLRLFRNGSLVRSWEGDVFKLGESDGCEQFAPTEPAKPRWARCRTQVRIVAGENEFAAYAFNREKVKSQDVRSTIIGNDVLKRNRTLYVLSIGVAQYENPKFNLSYSANDAQDFDTEIRRQQQAVGY